MDREEIYFQYQAELRRLEDEEEEYLREKKRFETRKEEFHTECAKNRRQLEELFSTWGDCRDTGILSADFEDSVEEKSRDLQKQEETLREKLNRVRDRRRDSEYSYQEEKRKLEQEESANG